MSNRTIFITLAVSAGLAFFFTLTLYVWLGRNPLSRLGYGIFISVLPAVGVYVVLKFARASLSWRVAALIYVLLFLLAVSQVFVFRYS